MPEKQKVVVIGAGQMGLGIAHAFALAGPEVVMVDVSQPVLDKAVAAIEAIIQGGVKLGKVPADKAAAAIAALATSTSAAEAAKGATLVIETATEKLDVKLKIMREIDAVVGTDTVLATNTSALSITEIAAASAHPERVVGMHFFNPVHKMKLVEIIRGLQTSEATVERLKEWSTAIGKTFIVVNEAPGFTTSRMSAMLGNEAMWMLSEGVATAEDIDTALRLAFNHPMGPLELGDLTGWDTRYAVLQHLHQTLGEKFRPCPLIGKMVKAGRYGRKVGHGVYKYENGEKVPGSGLRAHL
ncbi:3-hydroxybutyryl-CoA dehydrogenase [Rhodoligotrophos appendicifer]|uniref:3-hydroxyacyl-CoA dehydrogenase n=1 Tax=Rhodoligotrophos appendicifer TaxID=987056 RepID=UPI001184BCE3|nr:3-hydroxyacyl-CoA dehydrogenase [Rhodoligotrophos appendicifer]